MWEKTGSIQKARPEKSKDLVSALEIQNLYEGTLSR